MTLLIGFLEISTIAIAQITYATKDTAYIKAVEAGLSFLKKGDCKACLAQYQRAFAINQKSALSTLRAAACAQQCGQIKQALAYVNKAIELDLEATEDIWDDQTEYAELNALRSSPLSSDIQKAINKQKEANGFNPVLAQELKEIYEIDQRIRMQFDTATRVQRYSFQSPKVDTLLREMRRVDSINLIKVERILQQYGYPGSKLVGKHSSTVWLVIQHSPQQVQEKYLPMMQKAVDEGKLHKSNLALLIDRVRLGQGKKQLYGSQVNTGTNGQASFLPIEDEPNVNKRRAEMDLPPLEEYAKHWGINYVLPRN